MADRPHVLVIHTDQHRFDCLGATGNPDIRTPAFDAIAADGVVYDNSFCPYPVCTPSRYSLLCGQYVHQHLGWNNRVTLPGGIATFPRALSEAGYTTAAVGKMHVCPTYLDVGFQTMLLAEQDGPGRHDDDYHRWLRREGLVDGIDLMDQVREYRDHASQEYWDRFGAITSDLDEAHHSTTWIGERALEQLEGWDSGSPSLLMAGFIKPHHPFDPPAPWDAMYDPEALTVLPGWTEACLDRDLARSRGYFPHAELSEPALRQAMAMYYASISQIDHHLGRMVAVLKEKGLYDQTMIICTSDHGDYLGFHHLLLKGNTMYDPLVRVPLLIKYPGQTHAGRTDSALVSNVDLAPTILSTVGLDVPRAMAGVPLDDAGSRAAVFAESGNGQEYMVRTRMHKLIVRADGKDLLFDLGHDRYEMQNLIGAPGIRDIEYDLRERLFRWLAFEAPSRPHLDWDARLLDAPNVSRHGSDAWRESDAYFRRAMGEFLET